MKVNYYLGSPVKNEWKQNEWKHDCTHVDHNQLDPLYHIYTNIVDLWLYRHSIDFRTRCISGIGKYLTGCGLHWYCLVSLLFEQVTRGFF